MQHHWTALRKSELFNDGRNCPIVLARFSSYWLEKNKNNHSIYFSLIFLLARHLLFKPFIFFFTLENASSVICEELEQLRKSLGARNGAKKWWFSVSYFLKNVMQLRKECGCILSLQNTSWPNSVRHKIWYEICFCEIVHWIIDTVKTKR
jgi:hypothetical protein